MTWQMYWPNWWKLWPWYHKNKDIVDGWPEYYSHYAGFGPLQFHWYSR